MLVQIKLYKNLEVMMMELSTWIAWVWLFPLATTLHNLEEALYLPSWSQKAGEWHTAVKKGEFHFAVIILTIFAFFTTFLGRDINSLWFYINLSYIFAMLINVIFPHILATIYLKNYMPGLVTAVLLNLPIHSWLLWQAYQLEGFDIRTFAIVATITVVAIVLSIPLLFTIGRRVLRY